MEPSYPQLIILSYQELPTETRIEPYGSITLPQNSLPPEVLQAMNENPELNGVQEEPTPVPYDINLICQFSIKLILVKELEKVSTYRAFSRRSCSRDPG